MTIWLFADVAIRATFVLAAALLASQLLWRRSAATRHWVLAVGIIGALLVPAGFAVLPSWNPLAWQPTAAATSASDPTGTASGVETSTTIRLADDVAPDPRGGPASTWDTSALAALPIVWAVGAAVGLMWLVAGVVRLGVLSRRARPVDNATWRAMLETQSTRYGLRRVPRLVRSEHATLLVAWGGWRPTVVVPSVSDAWSADRIRIVLAHELAHIARADSTTLIVAEVLRALHWFNPLAWMVARRLRHESERACDDVVLNAGTDAHEYAHHLVGVARELRARLIGLPAPAMAAASSLHRRIVAMMNPALDRRSPSRALRAFTVVACLLTTAAVGSARSADPVPAAQATIGGLILDQTGAGVPGVSITVTDVADAVVGTTISAVSGRFKLPDLAPGTYSLEARLTGFETAVSTGIDVSGAQVVEREITLEVGGLEETVSIYSGGSATGAPGTRRSVADADERLAELRSRGICTVGVYGTPPGPVRVGGDIRSPEKIVNVIPVYPPDLASQGIEGEVILEGRINEDGIVEDLLILGDPNPGLSQAAVDAASQWQFTPTLLNGCRVPVVMTVTMNVSTGS